MSWIRNVFESFLMPYLRSMYVCDLCLVILCLKEIHRYTIVMNTFIRHNIYWSDIFLIGPNRHTSSYFLIADFILMLNSTLHNLMVIPISRPRTTFPA